MRSITVCTEVRSVTGMTTPSLLSTIKLMKTEATERKCPTVTPAGAENHLKFSYKICFHFSAMYKDFLKGYFSSYTVYFVDIVCISDYIKTSFMSFQFCHCVVSLREVRTPHYNILYHNKSFVLIMLVFFSLVSVLVVFVLEIKMRKGTPLL